MRIVKIVFGFFFAFFISFPLFAATITVTSTADSGAGSLRQAVADATSGDTINFSVTGTITLTSGEIAVDKALTIQGPGEENLTIASHGNPDRVFHFTTGSSSVSSLTIQDGYTLVMNNGGCILTELGAPLILDSMTFKNCVAFQSEGGAVFVQDDLTVTDSTFDQNEADIGGAIGEDAYHLGSPIHVSLNNITFSNNSGIEGGALFAQGGTVTVNNSLFILNTGGIGSAIATVSGELTLTSTTLSSGTGMGIFASDSTLTFTDIAMAGNIGSTGGAMYVEVYDPSVTIHITRATISNNTANDGGSAGGGIYFYGPDLSATLTNVTLAENHAPNGSGGGIEVDDSTVNLNNVTLAGNTALNNGGGILIEGSGNVNVQNSIIANNAASTGPDCDGNLTSQDYNLIEDITGCSVTGTTTHNIIGEDPQLGPLQNNGGPYNTMALAVTSPALNTANPATPGSDSTACATNDERGVLRPQGTACDMGAFELASGLISLSSSTYSVAQDAGSVTITVQRSSDSNTFDTEVTVTYSTSDGTAVAGTNYTSTSGTLTWAAGDSTSQTVNVPIINAEAATDLTFNFSLSNPTGAATLLSPSAAVVTIAGSGGGGTGKLTGGRACESSLQAEVPVSFSFYVFILLNLGILLGSKRWKAFK